MSDERAFALVDREYGPRPDSIPEDAWRAGLEGTFLYAHACLAFAVRDVRQEIGKRHGQRGNC